MGFAANDQNLYRFVTNNPANLTDPSGLFPNSFSPYDFPSPPLRDQVGEGWDYHDKHLKLLVIKTKQHVEAFLTLAPAKDALAKLPPKMAAEIRKKLDTISELLERKTEAQQRQAIHINELRDYLKAMPALIAFRKAHTGIGLLGFDFDEIDRLQKLHQDFLKLEQELDAQIEHQRKDVLLILIGQTPQSDCD